MQLAQNGELFTHEGQNQGDTTGELFTPGGLSHKAHGIQLAQNGEAFTPGGLSPWETIGPKW